MCDDYQVNVLKVDHENGFKDKFYFYLKIFRSILLDIKSSFCSKTLKHMKNYSFIQQKEINCKKNVENILHTCCLKYLCLTSKNMSNNNK